MSGNFIKLTGSVVNVTL
jgi:hypothetical protein